ncbi:hypothetical protein B4923_04825 [Brenneria roseae subsp. americana]|uniref:Integrase n=1 Tax=Brenneria roseae subsp. americana TaxID=1508507 RepID=A0A2U1TXX7_9GAMM|nr:hypothetical protein [Brenneria roseae]PWC14234.1 hypothetical protein B4923_04825 [Brenneria roseae subsp. americana]
MGTPRLKRAFELAKAIAPPHSLDSPVIASKSGGHFSKRGFSHHFEQARANAAEKLGYALNCTFHDLKAKGISDCEGSSRDKQLFSGHKTESQVLVYDQEIKVTPTLDKE